MVKKYTYIFCFLFIVVQSLFAQHNNELYNNGAILSIQSGAEVHVLGDVHMRTATTTIENFGLLVVQGNMYGDNLFQQRGTGTTRLINNLVNIGEVQKIASVGVIPYTYAVRSIGSSNKGINDGSFYNLELGNDQGAVYLEGSGNVADVRNSVDFLYGAGIYNRIITSSPPPAAVPVNGALYPATFGIMNAGNISNASLVDNTVSTNGNMSSVDVGYVQGKLRQEINPAGGTYGFVLGLEPAGFTAQKGLQYMNMNFGANTYDVLRVYYQTGSDNTIPGFTLECSNYLIDYFGGVDHGEWVISDILGGGAGTYTARVWPQDHNMPAETVWMITQNDLVAGTADECGGTSVGLQRSGLTGDGEIGVAGGTIFDPLPIELLSLTATPINDYTIKVKWSTATETNVDHFEIERSVDAVNTTVVGVVATLGNYTSTQYYQLDDINCEKNINYYYRIKTVDVDGTISYSAFVSAKITDEFNVAGLTTVYPNPVTALLNIGYSAFIDEALSVQLFNTLGQIIYSDAWIITSGENLMQINTENLAGGIYFLELKNAANVSVSKTKLVK